MSDYRFEYLENYSQSAQKQTTTTKGPDRSTARRGWGCWRFFLLLMQLGLLAVLLVALGFAGGYLYLSEQLGDAVDQVVAYRGGGVGGTPRFYDRHGNLLLELETAEKRRWLGYDEIPPVVVQATVAVEDDTFWTNPGFDPAAIVAAVVRNVRREGERPVGASTITQQLVRHIAFSYEERITASYDRKLRELFLAFILTRQRSKAHILEMYLNEIYYGNLAYGIEAAAQTYFGKSAAELTLAEASFLVGLPQAPVQLDPYAHFEAARERQALVLELMQREGMISRIEAEVARQTPLDLAPLLVTRETGGAAFEAAHFVLYVQQFLEERYGPGALLRDGWQITTSLDLGLQKMAESALREQVVARSVAHDVSNGAAVVMKPATGEILAMVGSLDYEDETIDGQVNIALRPRQPGSSIKPITYAAAMERGWTTGDVTWDIPIVLDLGNGQTMVPTNYDGRYHGPVLLRDALANSYNIPPIQIMRDIGIQAMISTARNLGIHSLTAQPGYYGLALTLGGGEVSLLEMTHAYATLANQGRRPTLMPVLRIENSRGKVVFDATRERLPAANAIDARIAYIISDILSDNGARTPAMGAYSSLRLPFPAAAKTGTTNDYRDNWTMGYTPGVVVGIWMGNADGHPMRNSSGLQGAAPVWARIMTSIYAEPTFLESLQVNGQLPPADFQQPAGIEEREVCLPRGTGGSHCTASRTDLFLVGGPTRHVARLGYMTNSNIHPGAWTLAIRPMGEQRVSLPPLPDGTTPPPPAYCVINSSRPPEGSEVRLFLPVPSFYPDEVRARRWAQSAGYQMAPPVVCPFSGIQTSWRGSGSEGTGTGGGGETNGRSGQVAPAIWRITSPAPGEMLGGLISVMGTAVFDPADILYYKLEIGSGRSPTSWTTFGTTHSQPVQNGVLEELHAYALPPGEYVIRLVLVGHDGNFATPYQVPVTIGP